MTSFAVQPVDLASVMSVSFKAGDISLGTDSIGENGFRVFLNATAFPAGPLQLTATASGLCGQTSQTITVNVVPNPPSNAIIGPEGGILATEIDSLVTLPPGSVGANTAVTITEKSQEQVTAESGIQWDALGVTFLGAQRLEGNLELSKPFAVSSAGFGNRVQPGQAVVNYQIAPDGDGDGIAELAMVNTASVAPNNDVLSDPVAQIVVQQVATQPYPQGRQALEANTVIAGPAGTLVELEGDGFNPWSVAGNVAIFRASGNGAPVEVPAFVYPHPDDANLQIFRTYLPPLAAGAATMTVVNRSTGAEAGPIAISLEAAPPLARPAAEIIDEFFAKALGFIDGIAPGTPGYDRAETMFSQGRVALVEARAQFKTLANNGVPQTQAELERYAAFLLSTGTLEQLNPEAIMPAHTALSPCATSTLVVAATAALTFAVLASLFVVPVAGVGLAVLAGANVLNLASLTLATAALIQDCRQCKPNPANNAPTTGMGSIMPTGGDSCGGAGGFGGGGGNSPSAQTASLSTTLEGRYQIKVYARGTAQPVTPFTGMTDAGGYFYIPIMPDGEPFTAVAVDRVTGAVRTFDGMGPPAGESVVMFFDFPQGDTPENQFEIAPGDTVSDGAPRAGAGNLEAPGVQDVYIFHGTPGEQVFYQYLGGTLDTRTGLVVQDVTGLAVEARQIGGAGVAIDLARGGGYSMIINPIREDVTGTYSFKLWPILPPQEFAINIGDTVSDSVPGSGAGNLETPGVQDVYTFNATPGKSIFYQYLSGSLDGRTGLVFRDSTGATVEERQIAGAGAAIDLAHGGVYTLTVNPIREGVTGTYSLKLWPLPLPQQFAINIGDTVSDSVPGPGAGNLETFGVQDVYTFNAAPGQQIVYEYIGGTLDTRTGLVLRDSTGATVEERQIGGGASTVDLSHGGVYTLTVNPIREGVTGTYSFRVRVP